MQKHSFSFIKTLPISFLPLFAAGITYFLQVSISYLTETWVMTHDQAATSEVLRDFSERRTIYDLVVLVLQQLGTLFLEIYDNCVVFVIVMMTLHFMIHHYKQKIRKSSFIAEFEKITPPNHQQNIKNTLTLILRYIINFYLLKLLVLLLSTCYASSLLLRMHSMSDLDHSQVILPSGNQQLMRKLSEEDQIGSNVMMTTKIPDFMEVIHESFLDDLFPYYLLLKNDFQIGFVVQLNGLAIYNISEPAIPQKIYFLKKEIKRFPSAVLSPKNRYLFLDAGSIQIFNVSDVQNPEFISEISFRTEQDLKAKNYAFHPSVAISSDEKYAICTDPRMQIYDISNISSPKLVWNQTWTATSASAILSFDDRTAFIGRYKSLLIMNVTDFRAPKTLSSYPLPGAALASTLSNDEKTLYLLCTNTQTATSTTGILMLHIFNITNLSSPLLLKQIDFGEIRSMQLLSIKLSPDGTLLAVRNATSLRILSLKDFRIFTLVPDSGTFTDMAFAPNGKTALVSSIGMMRFVEFHYNLISEYSSSLQPNFLSSCELRGIQKKQVSIAAFNQRAFILAGNANKTRVIFDIDLLNYSKPLVTQTFNFTSSTNLFTLSSNGNNIYYKSGEKVLQILSTQGQLSKGASIEFQQDFEQMFVVSSDEKTLFTLRKNYTNQSITIFKYDISVPASPKLVAELINPSFVAPNFFEYDSIYLALSADEKTLFLLDQSFWVFDISNEKIIRTLNVDAFVLDGLLTKTFAFSPDYKTCFVMLTPYLNKNSLLAIDLRNYSAPVTLSKIDLPVDSNYKLSISKDDRLLFVSSTEAFITVDISNKALIKISEVQMVKVSAFSADQNAQYVLIGNENGLSIMNRSPKYSLYLHEHQFRLGGVYKSSLMVLELNQDNRYNPLERSYKFIQASLYSIEIKPLSKLTVSYPTLPNWIDLDKENFAINLDLTLPLNTISYKIRFGVSTPVIAEEFLQIKGANFNRTEAENLQVHLVTLGYLDTEQYLTPHFNTETKLLLTSEYSLFEKEIRNLLKSHSIELLTTISIQSSLELLQTKSLQIKTPSMNSIHVTIELFSQKAQFVSQAFSAVKVHLNQEKTTLLLEGALLNINEALKELLINLEDGGLSCEGNITITDGLNPAKVEYFKRISDFLKINQKPQMVEKYSVQSQVDSVHVKAGEHFIIEFDALTFSDVNNRTLAYSLDEPEENMEVAGWITLRGRSLMGTPPEQFWPYKKQFCMIASNGEKSESVVFTLRIELSFVTILRRIVFLIGYLFTAYKAWKYSDRVYNVLLKRHYRYSKIIKIVPGKNIFREDIFPIILISKEMESLSKVMLGALKRCLVERKALNDQQFIEYFIDSNGGEIKRQKLIEGIELLLSSALNDKKIFEYQNKSDFEKKVVQELIVNGLTMKRIKADRATSEIFEKIKSKWIDLVEIDQESSSPQFIIKKMNFNQELRKHDISELEGTTTEYTENYLSKLIPLSDSKINIGLLKDAISAYAFNQQNIYANRYKIQIRSKELMKQMQSSWRRVLKMNMVDLFENSMKQLGYGLKYEFDGDRIVFYGRLKDQMKDKTLVVQITTKRGWILREFLIQGVTSPIDDYSIIQGIQEEL